MGIVTSSSLELGLSVSVVVVSEPCNNACISVPSLLGC